MQIQHMKAQVTDDVDMETAALPAQPPAPAVIKESLLRATAKARKDKPEETEAEVMYREEQEMLADMTKRTALRGVKELAKVGVNMEWSYS